MNLLEIQNAICYKIWGDSNPPAGALAQFRGANGIISNVHRKIQKDRNYWFMEKETTIPVVAGTQSYALPAGFREIVASGFRLERVTGEYDVPISPLNAGQGYSAYRTTQGYEFPMNYEIYSGSLYLYPVPSVNHTLYVRYYGYLDRPTVANFDTFEDALCVNGYDAIINLAASEMYKIMKEYEEAQAAEMLGMQALEILYGEDSDMRRAEITQIEYGGF